MRIRIRDLGAAALLGLLPSIAASQVDAAWLRSWNEAWQARPARLQTRGRIAPADEPGAPLVIRGRIVTPEGEPAPNIIVQSYHRDEDGYEFGPKDRATTTWRLQGWALTDAQGRFSFETVRPAADALGREGAHIHFTLVSEHFGRQWAPKLFLADDPLVSEGQRRASAREGAFGDVQPVVTVDERDVVEIALRLRAEGDF